MGEMAGGHLQTSTAFDEWRGLVAEADAVATSAVVDRINMASLQSTPRAGLSSPVCCGGTLVLDTERVQVTVGDAAYQIRPAAKLLPRNLLGYSREKLVSEQANSMRRLVDHASTTEKAAATAGRGASPLRNSGVGGQVPASAFNINIGPEHLRGTLEEIRRALGLASNPPGGAAIEAELHSLNVHRKGGHHLECRADYDSPRLDCQAGVFGVMVLCLPSIFVGGALEVGVEGGPTESFFGNNLQQRDGVDLDEDRSGDPRWWYDSWSTKTRIPWCAFLCDACHRVRFVRGGVRVMVTYLLRYSDSGATCNVSFLPLLHLRVLGSGEGNIQPLSAPRSITGAMSGGHERYHLRLGLPISPSSLDRAPGKRVVATFHAAPMVEAREASESPENSEQKALALISSRDQNEKHRLLVRSERREASVMSADKRELDESAAAEERLVSRDDSAPPANVSREISSRPAQARRWRRKGAWLLLLAAAIVTHRRAELRRFSQ